MEAATPAPAFNGHSHPPHPRAHSHFDEDEDDFGPETDVDMVDDVLLSPSIAAAKALVKGAGAGAAACLDDDLLRQRSQTSEYDDPADPASRDTPTPPADDVASNANADNLAESGGEDSEEEWNYIPGREQRPLPGAVDNDQEEEDMSSTRLNPDAAEFVPVSPTRMLMLDDAIISASPRLGFEKSLDNVEVPTEEEFIKELSQRTDSHKPSGDDYFMRDNFSTLRNKSKEFNSNCSDLADDSIISYKASLNASTPERVPFDKPEHVQLDKPEHDQLDKFDHVPFDKLEAVQNMEGSFFGTNNDFNGALAATNVFGKGDPMTTSVIGQLSLSPEPEEAIPGSPKSTVVEAPASPIDEEVSPMDRIVDVELPTTDAKKCIDFNSPVKVDENEGYITEHRRSPPLDLSYKPIQSFSDTNPFGAFQTPVTPVVRMELPEEQSQDTMQVQTPEKHEADTNEFFVTGMTPASFISLRESTDCDVTFQDLESPPEVPHFEPLPNAQSSMLVTESLESYETNVNDITQNLFPDEPSGKIEEEYEETSFSNEPVPKVSLSEKTKTDLDAIDFLKEETKIIQDEAEQEDPSKHKDEVEAEVHPSSDMDITPDLASVPISVSTDDGLHPECAPIDQAKHEDIARVESEPEAETKEMNLEFESHIVGSETIVEEQRNNPDEGFEIISKDELHSDTNNLINESFQLSGPTSLEVEHSLKDIVDLITPEKTIDGPSNMENLSASSDDDVIIIEPPIPELVDLTSSYNSTPFSVEDILSCNRSQLNDKIEGFEAAVIQNAQAQALVESEAPSAPVEPEMPALIEPEVPSAPVEPELPALIEPEVPSAPVEPEMPALIEPKVTSAPVEPETPVSIELVAPSAQVEPEMPAPIEPEALKTVSYQTLTPADEPKLSKTETYLTGLEGFEKSPALEETPAPPLESVLADFSKPVAEPVPSQPELTTLKSEPAQSQVVTETLIATLEEKSEVAPPSVTISEVTVGSAQTPPPTPTPAPVAEQPPQTDFLVAAVAAAGAVAAGSAVVAESVKKTSTSTTAMKKSPALAGAKKPTDPKAPAKPAAAKAAPTTKPGVKATPVATSKPTSAPTKLAGAAKLAPAAKTTVGAKPSTATAKTSVPAPSRPATADAKKSAAATKPAGTKLAATAATRAAAPPNKLAVNKTSSTALKSSSKPTTPNSNPATPTTPKSPGVKELVRSPPKPAVRSTLARPSTAPPKPAGDKSLTNGDVKAVPKKAELVTKKAVPATGAKPVPAKAALATATKPASAAAKPAAKPSTGLAAKAKPTPSAAPSKPAGIVPVKRPATTPVGAKLGDKTGKDAPNKTATKPAVNGKAAPAKMVNGINKPDAKGDKSPAKPVKSESSPLIQEDNVTTSNGFSEHADVKDVNNGEPVALVLN